VEITSDTFKQSETQVDIVIVLITFATLFLKNSNTATTVTQPQLHAQSPVAVARRLVQALPVSSCIPHAAVCTVPGTGGAWNSWKALGNADDPVLPGSDGAGGKNKNLVVTTQK